MAVICLRYTKEAPAKPKPVVEKPVVERAPEKPKPMLDKAFLDQDSEYLLKENKPDIDLDEHLKEELKKKQFDPRYIEMQVLRTLKVNDAALDVFLLDFLKITISIKIFIIASSV